jgi:LuxR family maltose regulon positive regulatory protein
MDVGANFEIVSKYCRPQVTRHLVPRRRLYDKLNQYIHLPLILVSAPAGYGKTTLLSAWATNLELPLLWMSLDEEDNDLQMFLHSLTAACTNIKPLVSNETVTPGNTLVYPALKNITRNPAYELGNLPECILVMDNYEVIHENQIHDFLAFLLKHPLSQLHLVLSTRNEPPLNIAGLRARSLLGEINQNDLKFTSEESTTFFGMVLDGQFDQKVLETISRQMEGWAAGISLSATALAQISEAHYFSTCWPHITDYLDSEVLSKISYQSRNLLYRLSVPMRLCAGLCDDLLADPTGLASPVNGTKILKRLEQENLFISVTDDKIRWHRLHPAFREVLITHLEEYSSKEELEQLHTSAAKWLAGHGYYQDALLHASKVPLKTAVSIFLNIRIQLIKNHHWALLEKWLTLFPADITESRAELLLAQAWLATAFMQFTEVISLLEKIKGLLSGDDFCTNPMASYEWSIIQAIYCLQTGDPQQAIQYLDNNDTEDTAGFPPFLEATETAVKIDAYRLAGDPVASLTLLNKHPVTPVSNPNQMTYLLLTSECKFYMISARLAEAERSAELMLNISHENDNLIYKGLANLYLGITAYQKKRASPRRAIFHRRH